MNISYEDRPSKSGSGSSRQVEFAERNGRGKMTIQGGSLEGFEHVGSSDRIVDHVKALGVGILGRVGFDFFFVFSLWELHQ